MNSTPEHPTHSAATLGHVVLYTSRLEECRDFYAGLGLVLAPEQHDSGPRHYAAVLADGCVIELYPAPSPDRATGRIRLGLTLDATAAEIPQGGRTFTDPDGRTVYVTLAGNNPP